mgnify:CR=1 FL=1
MITARRHWLGRLFWGPFIWVAIKLGFARLEVHGPAQPQSHAPVLLLPNHWGWWDGFFQYEMNRRHWRKRFYLMMLEKVLGGFPFFRLIGAYSINPGHRSMLQSLAYTVQLLQDPRHLVVIYPQGRFESLHTPVPSLQQAFLKRLVPRLPADTVVRLCVVLVDWGANPRPTACLYYEDMAPPESGQALIAAWQAFYQRSIQAQQARMDRLEGHA